MSLKKMTIILGMIRTNSDYFGVRHDQTVGAGEVKTELIGAGAKAWIWDLSFAPKLAVRHGFEP